MAGFKQSFVQALTETSTTEKDSLGDIRWEGNKCYKYVQYKATAIACVAGRMTGFYTMDGYKNNQVTLDTSDQPQAATLTGAGLTLSVIPTDGYGWVQIKGAATMSVAFVAGTDGDPVGLVGATADTGDLDLHITAVSNSHICGFIGDASDNELLVDCPF
tara:strand:+ start:517 stop:996 length:480 start_codon:yes stop_codon:yes gene_type:complete